MTIDIYKNMHEILRSASVSSRWMMLKCLVKNILCVAWSVNTHPVAHVALTFWPTIALTVALSLMLCSAITVGLCSFLNSMKAFRGFLMYGWVSSCSLSCWAKLWSRVAPACEQSLWRGPQWTTENISLTHSLWVEHAGLTSWVFRWSKGPCWNLVIHLSVPAKDHSHSVVIASNLI